jgi:hypothetical protein
MSSSKRADLAQPVSGPEQFCDVERAERSFASQKPFRAVEGGGVVAWPSQKKRIQKKENSIG